jgi:hypothetical protein
MSDENKKITVEVPADRNFSPLPPTPQQSRMEQFRRGWVDAIALPDNLADLIFDITAWVTIPALTASIWVNFPLPSFVRFEGAVLLVISSLALWQLAAIPEVRGVLFFRVMLAGVGVILGS